MSGSLSPWRKALHDFPWILHDFPWTVHDFPWILRDFPFGLSRRQDRCSMAGVRKYAAPTLIPPFLVFPPRLGSRASRP